MRPKVSAWALKAQVVIAEYTSCKVDMCWEGLIQSLTSSTLSSLVRLRCCLSTLRINSIERHWYLSIWPFLPRKSCLFFFTFCVPLVEDCWSNGTQKVFTHFPYSFFSMPHIELLRGVLGVYLFHSHCTSWITWNHVLRALRAPWGPHGRAPPPPVGAGRGLWASLIIFLEVNVWDRYRWSNGYFPLWPILHPLNLQSPLFSPLPDFLPRFMPFFIAWLPVFSPSVHYKKGSSITL